MGCCLLHFKRIDSVLAPFEMNDVQKVIEDMEEKFQPVDIHGGQDLALFSFSISDDNITEDDWKDTSLLFMMSI